VTNPKHLFIVVSPVDRTRQYRPLAAAPPHPQKISQIANRESSISEIRYGILVLARRRQQTKKVTNHMVFWYFHVIADQRG
jgi:hypothetical protein